MEIESGRKALQSSGVIVMGGVKYCRVGNSHVFFRKEKILCTIGPHWPGVVFTSALIILAAYLNVFIIRANHTSFGTLLIVFVCILAILAEVFLYGCALADPGIILPKSIQGEMMEEYSSLFTEYDHYCTVCDINQPKGAAHCSFCDVCVEKMDHHCPWMGKCIGRKNMLWFQCLIGVVVIYLTELIIVGLILPE
jgi:hypothetical protein